MRNRSFRQAKDSFRFGGFWALSRLEPNRRQSALREGGIVIARSAATKQTTGRRAPLDSWIASSQPVWKSERFSSFAQSLRAEKKLRESAAKPLRSFARVNMCGGL